MKSLVLPAHLDSIEPALAWARSEAPEWVSSEAIDFGLVELVTNAIVHGSASLGSRSAPAGGAHISISIERGDRACAFEVGWEIVACPREARRAREVDVWETTGRGLLIAESMFDRVAWREDGLAVVGEIDRPR